MNQNGDRGLIPEIRAEANELKECFTRFSFQAIAFSAVVFGLLAGKDSPSFAIIASITVTTMLLLVARIGTYKYGNANTLYGYQLHLERTRWLADTEDGWKSEMRTIGWEEAMRSWRVIQPTLFRHVYYWHPLLPNWPRREHRPVDKEKRWFEPSTLVDTAGVKAAYYPGGYLRLTLIMLHVLAFLSTIPVVIVAYNTYPTDRYWALGEGSIAVLLAVFVALRSLYDHARVDILEKGLLSIHSCAVMWQAVVLAHYRALETTRLGPGAGLENYTKNLAKQANNIRSSIFNIDALMGYKDRSEIPQQAS